MDAGLYRFILKLFEVFGPWGALIVAIPLLVAIFIPILVAVYLERKSKKDREEFRTDWIKADEIHRQDRNQWVETMKSLVNQVTGVISENNRTMAELVTLIKDRRSSPRDQD